MNPQIPCKSKLSAIASEKYDKERMVQYIIQSFSSSVAVPIRSTVLSLPIAHHAVHSQQYDLHQRRRLHLRFEWCLAGAQRLSSFGPSQQHRVPPGQPFLTRNQVPMSLRRAVESLGLEEAHVQWQRAASGHLTVESLCCHIWYQNRHCIIRSLS